MVKAVGYIRVSGKSQIDGDGFQRQTKAIMDYAKANNIEITKIYQENGISGTLLNRPALTDMMIDLTEDSEIHTIIIERIDRLARDLMIQENILYDMKKKDIEIISVVDGDLLEDDPTRKLVRQVLGAIAEYDKTMLVAKLKAAKDRIKATGAKCEGRKSYQELNPDLIEDLKKLRRKPRNGKRLSLQKTLESLQEKGYTSSTGEPLNLQIVKNLIYRGLAS